MLTKSECSGLRDLLRDVEDQVLFSILETVTKRMFKTSCRQEAIEKILTFSRKPSDVLRRQKVTKKILFNYLARKGVTGFADLDKGASIRKCLEFWGSVEKACDYIDEPRSIKNLDVATCMKVAFTKRFFRIWNTSTGFGPEHFWPHCRLTAELYSHSGCKKESRRGAMDVAIFLANLISADRYYFLANDSEDSIKLEIERHGIVMLLINGFLHQFSNCIGLFDCAFGLIENPFVLVENPKSFEAYKIQWIHMKLQVNSSV